MILDRMQISGFLSYNEEVVIDFSDFDLACISGANGAGKSSLLEAITWVLFGEARRRDDAVINQHATTAEVILNFWYENQFYQVQRSKTRDKSTLLEFRIRDSEGKWIPLTEPSLRATEDRIRNTLCLDYDTFINASFFLQGKADQFAQQRPGDRKRILSGILGLDIWETYREETARRRRSKETELDVVNNLLEEIEAELSEENNRKARLAELEKELAQKQQLCDARKALLDQQRLLADRVANDRKAVERQRAEIQRLQADLDRSVDNLNQRRSEMKKHLEKIQQEDQINQAVARWEAARQALSDWEAIAVNFHQYEAKRQGPLLAIEGERARLQTEFDTLELKKIENRTIENQLPSLEKEVEDYAAAIASLKQQLDTRADIESEMRRLSEEKARAKAENTQLHVEMNELTERIRRLEETKGATCPTCEKPLNSAERIRLIEDLKARGKVKGDTYRENQKIIEQCDNEYREKETALANLKRVEADLQLQQRLFDNKSSELSRNQKDLEHWKQNGEKRLEELGEILRTENYALDARRELAAIDASLKDLGYDAAAHEAVRKAELEGRQSQQLRLELEQARAALVPLEREIKELETTIDKDEKHMESLEEEYCEAEKKLAEESAGLPDFSKLEREYYEIQEQVNQTLGSVGYTRNQVDVLDRQREQKAVKLEEKERLTDQIANLKVLERAFGKDGIPALLIEQALPEIENHANDILDRLSSGEMAIKFETQREFKDKKREDRRETLDILIRDASGERPYEMFSGGEAFRVNFAIRLALSRVLARRAGARLQTLVIDEGFGSQDSDGRQRLVEAINLVRTDFAKILVITHLEELKDAFPARIEVTKTQRGSRVQVLT
ncbi:MAG: SMC family ATPase [Anaerolineaceae bacterium]|nr:SMC family ATPase [Anaerolineaceae bacterium]